MAAIAAVIPMAHGSGDGLKEIEYFGHVISPNGLELCPQKVKAILKLQPSSSKQELQSFLGTVNLMAINTTGINGKERSVASDKARVDQKMLTMAMYGQR